MDDGFARHDEREISRAAKKVNAAIRLRLREICMWCGCSRPRPCASTTAIAVILTMPRAVTEGVTNMGGSGRADQDRADGQRIGQPLGELGRRCWRHRDSGMISTFASPSSRECGITRSRMIWEKRRIGLHFAIDFERGCALADESGAPRASSWRRAYRRSRNPNAKTRAIFGADAEAR